MTAPLRNLIEAMWDMRAEGSELPDWPCPLCGADGPADSGHDPCIENLPGVEFACCGHGKRPGYVKFTDGRVLRGVFDHHHDALVPSVDVGGLRVYLRPNSEEEP